MTEAETIAAGRMSMDEILRRQMQVNVLRPAPRLHPMYYPTPVRAIITHAHKDLNDGQD